MSLQENTLALAGIFQSAELVRQIARQGMIEQAPFESSIDSILKIDADSIIDVYGGLSGLKLGLQQIVLNGVISKKNLEVMRYVRSIMIAEKQLMKRSDMLTLVRQGLQDVIEQAKHCPVTDPQICGQLAQLYTQTLSTFPERIQVAGEPRFLQNPHNTDKVRSLLLAGIRSAVLWKQKGGKRWHLLFSWGKITRFAETYLEKIALDEQTTFPSRTLN